MKIQSIAPGTYNPSQIPREVLLAEFTARREMLADLLDILRSNVAGEPSQHSLLIGPRGFGKTTSLFALKYRVQEDTELSRAWTPLLFDEENYQITDLAGFWLECLRLAETAFPSTGKGRYEALNVSRDPKLESLACEAFLSVLDQEQRSALLLIDNINDILAVVSDEKEQHRLRAFLLEESRVCVVGTASTYFSAIQNDDKPFYNLFRTFRLDRFTPVEMRSAVQAMVKARTAGREDLSLPTSDGYWKGLHILTGGNPRLVKMVFHLMEQGVTSDFRAQLEGLLDAYTPYFKHRIESMSPQQRRVFDAIALAWDPVTISDIAPGLRMESNQISAQIRTLVDAQLIAIAGGSAKRRVYQITDRFSNIYYFMRYSRAGRSRFEWFIITMKAILTPEQFRTQLDRMRTLGLACAEDTELRDQAHLLVSATRALDDPDIRRSEGHKNVAAFISHSQGNALRHLLDEPGMAEVLRDEHSAIRFFAELPPEDRAKINYQPEDAGWWYGLTDFAKARSQWTLAETAFRKAIGLDPTWADPWFGLGNLLKDHLQRFDQAEEAYRKTIELAPSAAEPWNSLGNLLKNHLQRFDQAEEAYLRSIELDPSYAYPWHGLGNLLKNHFQRFGQAEEAYRRAIELDPSAPYPWNSLGNLLKNHLQRFDQAEEAYRKAIELDPSYPYPWNGLGNLLKNHLQRFDQAEEAYRKTIELDPSAAEPWNGLGNLLNDQFQKFDEAEAAYRKAIELNPTDPAPWNGLGNLLKDPLQRFDEAEAAYRKAIELAPSYAYPKAGLADLMLDRKGRTPEAVDLATAAILAAPLLAWPQQAFRAVVLPEPSAAIRGLEKLIDHFADEHADTAPEGELYELALDCVVSLLRHRRDEDVLALIDHPATRDIFDVVIHAIAVRKNPEARKNLATERLALVDALLDKVALTNEAD